MHIDVATVKHANIKHTNVKHANVVAKWSNLQLCKHFRFELQTHVYPNEEVF